MKVIFLTQYFTPEQTASMHLSSNLTEDLVSAGVNVEVITQMPVRAVGDQIRLSYKDKVRVESGGLTINRINIPGKELGSFMNRVFRSLLATFLFFIKALSIKGDVIFAYSTPPTMGIMGVILGKLKGIPVVYNLQDIFPDSLITTGKIKEGLFLRLLRWIEKLSYIGSSRIVVICQDFKHILIERGVRASKVDLVYNWIDETEVVSIPRNENLLISRYRLPMDDFYITYCGNIGYTQNLELLIDVAKSLEYIPDMRFVIIGEGAYKLKLEMYVKETGAANVHFLPYQPYEEISHVFSLGDVGIISSIRNTGNNSFPSKTWSIMSAARPVLASFDVESELCKIIKDSKCGICIPPENMESFCESILEMYNQKDSLKTYGENGRQYILNNLRREIGTRKIYNILSEVIVEKQ